MTVDTSYNAAVYAKQNDGGFVVDGVDATFYSSSSSSNYAIWDASEPSLKVVHASMDGSAFPFIIEGTATSATAGARQGAIYCQVYRESGSNMTSSDGNPDTAMKIRVRNYATGADYIRTRAFEAAAEFRSGASGYYCWGGYISAKTYSGSTVTDVTGLQVELNHGATGSGTIAGLIINEISQSGTGTMHGLRIQTANYNITREYAISIDSTNGSWTNGILFDGTITNALDFADNDGTNGATLGTHSSHDTNPSGHIKIDVGGATRYIYIYTNAVTFS